MRIPLLAGRTFDARDDASSPHVTVVNRSLAERLWPGQSPLGKRLKVGGPASRNPWLTVVGVVGNHAVSPVGRGAPPYLFTALLQRPSRDIELRVRTAGDPMTLAAPVRAEVKALDPDLPVTDLTTTERALSEWITAPRFITLFMMGFAAFALALAALGVYGLVAYSVGRRTHEIGIRMALGADYRAVVRLLIAGAVRLAGVGLALGLVAAFVVTRVISAQMVHVRTADPALVAAAAMLLFTVVLAASYLPARRARRVDPLTVLRSE
jgi:putative ABC transport system permease protein